MTLFSLGLKQLVSACQGVWALPLKISHLEIQVADRIIMHRGDKCNWHSTVLRLRMSSVLDKAQRESLPQRSLGLSARGRAAFPHSGKDNTNKKSSLTVNASADIRSLDRMGFLSRAHFTPSHLPSTSIVIRKDMQAGQRITVAAHINREISHGGGWHQVRTNMSVSCLYIRHG